jgi:DNA invertase Pin-like site-specific DNA recombinase
MVPKPLQRRYVAYYRVSTERQGRSGLGLEAQKASVLEFLRATGDTLRDEYVEIQSGKDNGRPKLAEALRLCRLTRSTLLIAKLDRLSRDAAFLLTLQNAGTRFVAVDNPDMNETVVGILAVIAQAERKAISERTKSALAAAKRRGVMLGNPKLKPGTAATALAASKAASAVAKGRAEELRELFEDARSTGATSLRAVAEHFNALDIGTPRGGKWAAASIARLLMQLGKGQAADQPRKGSHPSGPQYQRLVAARESVHETSLAR